ncbi:hypothetical protein LUZ63_013639 [Rhynchospora breviuscula]|uniref:Protein kinase domain-containing protein n=1 Tax=Rhynchospora breviuscula TaxID=2022672 RepID=A0A9Q0C8X8_9POAL|nr:hypothetical protein LUZ63_013639 [Rhynchospora breviuscula]
MYGNYDGLNSAQPNQSLLFDLYIGVNPWMTVNITDASKAYWFEAATVAPTSFIWLCLVNTGQGTPFISILEIRPLTKNLYPYVSDNQSIAFELHLNYGPTNQTIRYPDDEYDRIWVPQLYDPKIVTGLSTTDNITVYPDNYEAPLAVLQTAIIPANNATNLTFLEWSPDNPNIGYVFVAFYSNVHIPPTNGWRTFNVFLNGKFSYGPYADPPYLQQYYANNPQPLPGNYFSWSFNADFNSTLPPIINAMEVFSVIPLRNFYTDFNDGNSFTGSIPSNLKKKADAGIINLIIKQSPTSSAAVDDDPELNVELRHFTYTQLKNITNNFSVEIGRGGFGTVYHGKLDNSTEVAVKVSSQPTAFHMTRQFLTEVRNLLQVHHKNLVYLIGYCKDREHLALIYEYMPFGSLHDHLRGKFETSRALNWGERLRIAHDAAQGLHYLHTGCNIIHRDVKTSNILLGSNLEAKIADFGLSKVSGNNSSPPTFSVVGTLGYIDPEYVSVCPILTTFS